MVSLLGIKIDHSDWITEGCKRIKIYLLDHKQSSTYVKEILKKKLIKLNEKLEFKYLNLINKIEIKKNNDKVFIFFFLTIKIKKGEKVKEKKTEAKE